MRLGSVRDLLGIQPVLMNKDASGPDPVYYMFNEISPDPRGWFNMTLLVPGRYEGEFTKTFGHYHGAQVKETYRVISGTGIFLLQEKKFDQKMWLMEQVSRVIAVKAEAGDEITITPEWGHSWSNIGNEPLVLYDNWRSGHTPQDYAVMERLQGLSYYLTFDNGKISFVPNNHYQNLPEVEEMSADEFKALKKG